ncbi:MAG: tail fiber domain-containing protein, partial [Candidatus Falkowbacteria bacterium]
VNSSGIYTNLWTVGRRATTEGGGYFYIAYTFKGSGISFYNEASHKFVIKPNGYVGIGTNNPSYQLQLSSNSAGKPTSGTWTIVSDARLKKDIKPFNDGLNVIEKTNPVSYKLNGKAGTPMDEAGIGVIAQDILDVAPYTIQTWKAKLEATDTEETELYNFDASALTFVLINAVKEQQKQIDELKSEIEELQNEVNSLPVQAGK